MTSSVIMVLFQGECLLVCDYNLPFSCVIDLRYSSNVSKRELEFNHNNILSLLSYQRRNKLILF